MESSFENEIKDEVELRHLYQYAPKDKINIK